MKRLIVAVALLCTSFTFAKGQYDVSLIGEVTDESLSKLYDDLAAQPDGSTVQVRIDSPGGDAIATIVGLDVIGTMIHDKGLVLECRGTGLVASAALVLYEGLCNGKRSLAPSTLVLAHAATMGNVGGKVGTIEQALALLRALNRALAAPLAARMNISVDEAVEWEGDTDHWLTPDQAVSLGLADEVR